MPTDSDPDIVRLRKALRDLVALSTVPAAWVGREPPAIAAGLADVLTQSLGVDFAFVRLCDPKGGAAVEVSRGNAWTSFPEWLQHYLAVIGRFSYREVIPDVGGHARPCRGVIIPIGVHGEGGLVAAASGRTNFPDEIDQLLLSVAANHAATACQSARLLHERRRAEEALRESEQRWRSMAEALPQLVWGAAADGACDYFSTQWTEYTGIPESELLGWCWLDVLHPDDREPTQQCWKDSVAGGRPYDVEYRVRRRDGVYGWFKTRGVPIRDSGGNIVKWFGSCTDITDLKRLEAERHRFISLVENSTEFVGMCDLSMKLFFVNDAGRRILGLDSLQQALETDVKDYFFPEDREFVFEQFLPQALREGRGDVEVRFRHFKSGAPIWMLYSVWPFTGSDGSHVGFATVSRDISERKRAEEELRQARNELEAKVAERTAELRRTTAEAIAAQQRFRALVNTLEGIVWEADAQTFAFSFVSDQAKHILGYSADRWSEPTFWRDHLHPEDRDWAVEFRIKATSANNSHDCEYRMIAADGRVVWLRDLVTVVVEGDRATRLRGVMVDVTKPKLGEEALRQARADLAHVSRVTTMGELTASLAHEIRQPIAAAATNASACLRWLARDPPDVKEACDAASGLVKDTSRATDIINRIHLLFKKGAPQRELVDVNEVIREMSVLLHHEATRCSISIRLELDPDLPQVMADHVQLQQVLMNLMLNGIEAMKDMTPAGELTIKSRQDDNHLLISVSDTGVGLSPDQADQIFKAFFTTKPQGTGMGLAISRSIIESHGGRLWPTANAGRGATFHLTLPREVEMKQPGQKDPTAARTATQAKSIFG
jgi:PAS domain S-box-containing protein